MNMNKTCTKCQNLKPWGIIKCNDNMECIECGRSFAFAPIPEYYKVKVWCSNCKYEEVRILKKGSLPFEYKCSNCECEKVLTGIGEYIK